MRKIYVTHTTRLFEIDLQNFLAASASLKYTDKEADKEYEVLTKHKKDWEYNWE